VAKVERRAEPNSNGIAGGGDVIHMQFGAAIDELLHCVGIEIVQPLSVPLNGFKEAPVANQRHFDRLDVPGPFVARRERGEEFEVVDDRKRRCKGADEILFAEALMPFLTPTPESAWLSVVVGIRTSRQPRCAVARPDPPRPESRRRRRR